MWGGKTGPFASQNTLIVTQKLNILFKSLKIKTAKLNH